MLLIEEIEALHVDVWNAKTSVAISDNDSDSEADSQDDLDRTLGARLRRLSRGPSRRRQ